MEYENASIDATAHQSFILWTNEENPNKVEVEMMQEGSTQYSSKMWKLIISFKVLISTSSALVEPSDAYQSLFTHKFH